MEGFGARRGGFENKKPTTCFELIYTLKTRLVASEVQVQSGPIASLLKMHNILYFF